ncbi:MAG: EamA family transporter [Paracoccaceae bacterium]
MSASLFGLVTILLAAFILRERISPKQWIAILFVFFGLTILSY